MPLFFRSIAGVVAVLFCGFALAATDSDLDAGIDLQFEREHQVLKDSSANATVVDIAPHLQYGNWDFSLDVPWISADAAYVNSNFPSRLVTACGDPVAAVAAKYPNLSARRVARIAARLSAYCQGVGVLSPGDTVSGLSDITAFGRYGVLLDGQGVWLLSLGAGYKFDNGDAEKNLGSSTRNTMLEATLGANYGKLTGALTGGYAWVSGGDALVSESHYGYASLDMGLSPANWVTLGVTVDYDQSYMVTADDLTKVTLYVKLKSSQHLRFKVYARDYGSAAGYPDREYGGSLAFVY